MRQRRVPRREPNGVGVRRFSRIEELVRVTQAAERAVRTRQIPVGDACTLCLTLECLTLLPDLIGHRGLEPIERRHRHGDQSRLRRLNR